MPLLDLRAGVSTRYQYLFGLPEFDLAGNPTPPQSSFGEEMRHNFGQGLSLGLSIPIFNRNATRNNVRLARLGVQNQTLALEGVKLALYKEIQQAHQRAVAAGARRDAAARALAASEEAFRAMELRYESGKATVYEYSDAQTKLLSSRSSQLQAWYDRLFSIKILDFYSGRAIDL
jgi:outer membrane protein